MKRLTQIAAVAALLSTLLSPLQARDITAAQTAAVAETIAQFEGAFQNGDMKQVVAGIPPKIIGVMADQFSLTPDELRQGVETAISSSMEQVTIVSFNMDQEAATSGETSAGRFYLLIPTTTVMQVEDNTFKAQSATLAFADEGQWYLVRIDDAQQIGFLTQAYPDFEGVAFPTGTMQVESN